MKTSYDIIVVGGGIIGTSVFERLTSELDKKVLLIEKSKPGFGSTAYSGGILRTFHMDPMISDSSIRGLRFYQELCGKNDNKASFRKTGFLSLIDRSHLESATREYKRLSKKVALEWLTTDQAADRFSLNYQSSLSAAVFEPEAGVVDPYKLNDLLLGMAKQHGGSARVGVELQKLKLHKDGVSGVVTNIGDFDCENVILCTGAWSPVLTKQLGIEVSEKLRSKAIQINLFETQSDIGELPAFVDLGSGAYGRPQGEHTAYVGCPVEAWDIDPDIIRSSEINQQHDAAMRGAQSFEWLNSAAAVGGCRAYDAYTPSSGGIVEWSASVHGVIIATGFSGSGVKLAPAAADTVLGLMLDTAYATGTAEAAQA